MPPIPSHALETKPYWYKKEPNEERDCDVVARQEKRLAIKEEREDLVEELKSKGNAAFKAGDYPAAEQLYNQALDATRMRPRLGLPIMLNLIQTFLKMDRPDDAKYLADAALLVDPKNIKARYRRGLARKARGQPRAAIIGVPCFSSAWHLTDDGVEDFETILELDPNCEEAKAQLLNTAKEVARADPDVLGPDDGYDTSDDEEPAINSMPFPPDDGDESDTSDYFHEGNGTPCRYYNQSRCKRGVECSFSHAPDPRAVRDKLGRNVCLDFIMGVCTHSLNRCYFSHSTIYLPVEERKGKPYRWWRDKKEVAQRWMASCAAAPRPPAGGGGYPGSSNRAMERALNGGFTNDQLEELACQGVKPWDEDAWDVLRVLGA
ncbi:TPR-like protein [Auricularia subglabra TFB-10046 SS5]|nr:TPR-like protein [Auricularia subglabra TFB-10046 SS5]